MKHFNFPESLQSKCWSSLLSLKSPKTPYAFYNSKLLPAEKQKNGGKTLHKPDSVLQRPWSERIIGRTVLKKVGSLMKPIDNEVHIHFLKATKTKPCVKHRIRCHSTVLAVQGAEGWAHTHLVAGSYRVLDPRGRLHGLRNSLIDRRGRGEHTVLVRESLGAAGETPLLRRVHGWLLLIQSPLHAELMLGKHHKTWGKHGGYW